MTMIVLHHGLLGYNVLRLGPARVRYWDGIPQAIAQSGYTALTTRVHPTAGIVRRAEQLTRQIVENLALAESPSAKVVIIAHSMGGLDARYAITHLGLAGRVSALVTISSPHHGCSYFDHLIGRAGMLGRSDMLQKGLIDVEAFWDVTLARVRVFNDLVPDAPGVRYYSVTAACTALRVPAFLRSSYVHLREAEGENDGMVSVQSARWGVELGHWPFHHLHLVNWRLRGLSPPSTEDVRPRYLQLLSLLHADGALEPPSAQRSVQPLPA